MESGPSYIRWFSELGVDDVAEVGGKNASLGELYRELTPLGVNVPNGFAVTASAYRDTLTAGGAWGAASHPDGRSGQNGCRRSDGQGPHGARTGLLVPTP